MAFINHPYYNRLQMVGAPMVGPSMVGAPIMMIPRPQTSSSDDLEKRIKDHVDMKISDAVSKLPSGAMFKPIDGDKLKGEIMADIQNYIKGDEVMQHFDNSIIALPLLKQYINDRIGQVNNQIQSITSQHTRYDATIQAMEQKIEELEQASESNSSILGQLRSEYAKQEGRITAVREISTAQTEKCTVLQKEIDALKNIFESPTLDDFKKDVDAKLKEFNDQKIGHDAFNTEIDRLNKEFTARKNATDDMITRTIATQLNTIKHDIDARHNKLAQNYGELASLYGTLNAQIQQQQTQIAEILGTKTGIDLTNKLHRVAQELAVLRQSKSDYETSIDAKLKEIVENMASNPSVKRAIDEIASKYTQEIEAFLPIHDALNLQYNELLTQVGKTKSEGISALQEITQKITRIEEQIIQIQEEGRQIVDEVLLMPPSAFELGPPAALTQMSEKQKNLVFKQYNATLAALYNFLTKLPREISVSQGQLARRGRYTNEQLIEYVNQAHALTQPTNEQFTAINELVTTATTTVNDIMRDIKSANLTEEQFRELEGYLDIINNPNVLTDAERAEMDIAEIEQIEVHRKAITAPQQTVQQYLNERCATEPNKCDVNTAGLQVNYGDINRLCKRSSICKREGNNECVAKIQTTFNLQNCENYVPSASEIKKQSKAAQRQAEAAQRQEQARRQAKHIAPPNRDLSQLFEDAEHQEYPQKTDLRQRFTDAQLLNKQLREAKAQREEENAHTIRPLRYIATEPHQANAPPPITVAGTIRQRLDAVRQDAQRQEAQRQAEAHRQEAQRQAEAPRQQAEEHSLRPRKPFMIPRTSAQLTAQMKEADARNAQYAKNESDIELTRRFDDRFDRSKYYSSQQMYGGSMMTSSEEVDSIMLSETSAN